jgi:GcrA cell cycle regulator
METGPMTHFSSAVVKGFQEELGREACCDFDKGRERPMSDAGFTWTDERVELLRRLWLEGLSASQVAATLGGVTRNAVIGKIHRLGLSGRGKASTPSVQVRPRTAKARRADAPSMSAPLQGTSSQQADPAPIQDAVRAPRLSDTTALTDEANFPPCERVTIMDLRDSMCRWPIGDPTLADFGFCGARCAPGVPYCTHHAQIAYQPSSERRREKRAATA